MRSLRELSMGDKYEALGIRTLTSAGRGSDGTRVIKRDRKFGLCGALDGVFCSDDQARWLGACVCAGH